MCLLFIPDFKRTSMSSKSFNKKLHHKLSRKLLQLMSGGSVQRTDGWTDITKLRVDFHNVLWSRIHREKPRIIALNNFRNLWKSQCHCVLIFSRTERFLFNHVTCQLNEFVQLVRMRLALGVWNSDPTYNLPVAGNISDSSTTCCLRPSTERIPLLSCSVKRLIFSGTVKSLVSIPRLVTLYYTARSHISKCCTCYKNFTII